MQFWEVLARAEPVICQDLRRNSDELREERLLLAQKFKERVRAQYHAFP